MGCVRFIYRIMELLNLFTVAFHLINPVDKLNFITQLTTSSDFFQIKLDSIFASSFTHLLVSMLIYTILIDVID